MAKNKPATWRNNVLECLPSSVSKDERGWIESRLENFLDLKMVFEKLGAGVLSNLLRFCFQIHNEKKKAAIPPCRGKDELALQARRARTLAKYVRTYAKHGREDSVYVWATEQEEEGAFPQGIKTLLPMDDLARALEEFARQLDADKERQNTQKLFSHIHYRKPPRQGDRPDFRELHLVGGLTNLFRNTYKTPHYGITASLFSATFGRTIGEEAVRKIIERMKAQGAAPVTIGE